MAKKCAKTPSTKKRSVLCVNDYWRHKPDNGVFGSAFILMMKHIIGGREFKQVDWSLHLLWWRRNSSECSSVHVFQKVRKKKLKDIFKKLRQRDDILKEYEQELTHILNCNPFVVPCEMKSTRLIIFQWGLWPKIY